MSRPAQREDLAVQMNKVITGNHAVSFGAKLARAEVIAAYPITPQTEVVEKLSEIVAGGGLNAKFIKVESEHSAMAACIGASAAGARSFTATSSQGLLLMHEMLHWAAGARLPVVMANINRTVGPPWNIWSEQTDSLAQRDTGWLQFYCENNQEILDTTIQLFRICEAVSLPGMVCLDAFYHSHTSEPVDIPAQEDIDKLLPPYNPKHKLDPNEPHAFGGLTGPEWYYELRYNMQSAMVRSIDVIRKTCDDYAKITGRKYALVEEYKTGGAEQLLITAGAISQTAKDAVDILRQKGERIGLARIRAFRPFPKEGIRAAIKKTKIVGVIDRDISFGSEGIFFQEVKAAFYNERPRIPIYGFIAGLGGRDVTTDDIIKIAHKMSRGMRGGKEETVWVGAKI